MTLAGRNRTSGTTCTWSTSRRTHPSPPGSIASMRPTSGRCSGTSTNALWTAWPPSMWSIRIRNEPGRDIRPRLVDGGAPEHGAPGGGPHQVRRGFRHGSRRGLPGAGLRGEGRPRAAGRVRGVSEGRRCGHPPGVGTVPPGPQPPAGAGDHRRSHREGSEYLLPGSWHEHPPERRFQESRDEDARLDAGELRGNGEGADRLPAEQRPPAGHREGREDGAQGRLQALRKGTAGQVPEGRPEAQGGPFHTRDGEDLRRLRIDRPKSKERPEIGCSLYNCRKFYLLRPCPRRISGFLISPWSVHDTFSVLYASLIPVTLSSVVL